MPISRESVVLLTLAVVALMYVATVFALPHLANDVLELAKYVVIAIVAYYLGYARREVSATRRASADPSVIEAIRERLADLRTELSRIGYIMIGFGTALILHHVVTQGVDLTILSHEWIGILALIAGMLFIGWSQHMMHMTIRM